MADHGSQVLCWQPLGAGARPVLWFDPSDPRELPGVIRGGVPVCAPWFGHGPADDRRPQHGVMRLTDFDREVLCDRDDRLVVRHRAALPGVRALHTVEMTGSALSLALTLTSSSSSSQCIEAVWHSYLRVGDAARARIEGLRGSSFHNYATGDLGRVDDDRLAVTVDTDTVLQDPAGPLVLVDPAWQRRISLSTGCGPSRSCPTVVVWNPLRSSGTRTDATGSAWRDFVCLETGAAKQRAIELAPGRSITLTLRISVADGPAS